MPTTDDSPDSWESLDGTILGLHSAIDREGLWRGVRDALESVCDFNRVTLFLGHLGMGEARVVYTEPAIEQSAAWFSERGKLNPFSRWIEQHVGAPYYRFRDIVGDPEAFKETEFYRRFARAEGWDKGVSVMFWRQEEMLAMFSLYRSPEQPEFTDDELHRILRMARHVEVAVARVQQIHRDHNFRNALQAFARTLPAPLLLLDWNAKLFFANPAAYESAAVWNFGPEKARSFNPRECFRVPGTVLEVVQRLKARMQAIDPRELSGNLPKTVDLPHPLNPNLQASVSPAYFGQSSLARPGFFVLFKEPIQLGDSLQPEAMAAQKTRALAALTPAEREVVRHICAGASNAEIADALNKSVLTVKTQVNSIFQKLGLRSRTQLVSRLK